MDRKQKKKHLLDLPLIARAIEDYKKTGMTQKECAEKYKIPIKVFSYYYLNGIKKIKKAEAIEISLPPEHIIQRKAKPRQGNYDIELEYDQQQKVEKPVSIKQPVNSTNKNIVENVKEKFDKSIERTKTGQRRIDLDVFLH